MSMAATPFAVETYTKTRLSFRVFLYKGRSVFDRIELNPIPLRYNIVIDRPEL